MRSGEGERYRRRATKPGEVIREKQTTCFSLTVSFSVLMSYSRFSVVYGE